jgi:RNA polymerase sigma factor (sigma-70 family)
MSPESHQLDPHQWVKAHADYLYAYTIKRISDTELSRDLVQETFLAALEKVHNFQGKSSERTWLTGLNKEVLQAEHEQDDFFGDDGHWNSKYAPSTFGIDHIDPLIDKEFNSILQKCMQKLPALWMSVFTMKHMDDEETNTICSELKVTPANFWVIIHRTKLNLRACLQKNWI